MGEKKFERNILVTGGAGFIGSHVVRLFVNRYPNYRVVNYDKLTYAGNKNNLLDVAGAENYVFERGDICDFDGVKRVFERYGIDGVINLAAESHVDRSIENPLVFAQTNVLGTLALLEVAKRTWCDGEGGFEGKLFYHVSTDEVYGALDMDRPEGPVKYGTKMFTETTPYAPHSPYSASKASSDHFVRAFHDTYGLPTLITNCSNNYGPNQFPEKLIPLCVMNIVQGKRVPVYGEGKNVRDWLYVEDHARAIDTVFHHGRVGECYNIGGGNERRNIDVVRTLIRIVDRLMGRREGASEGLIEYVRDRSGHDLRYAIDSGKLVRELGWQAEMGFEEGIERTVRWYLDNGDWIDDIVSGRYRE